MKKIISEFKEFALKGNMLDLAIGLMIGTAFTTVVKSIVDDLFMPIIGVIIGGKDFSALVFKINEAEIKYGLFIQNLINFLIIAVCLFLIVKTINTIKRRIETKEDAPEEAPAEKPADIVLLEEIRDSLKELQNK